MGTHFANGANHVLSPEKNLQDPQHSIVYRVAMTGGPCGGSLQFLRLYL